MLVPSNGGIQGLDASGLVTAKLSSYRILVMMIMMIMMAELRMVLADEDYDNSKSDRIIRMKVMTFSVITIKIRMIIIRPKKIIVSFL